MHNANVDNLYNALGFLRTVVKARCELHFSGGQSTEIADLSYFQDDSEFGLFIDEHKPTFDEYVVLLLALVPHVELSFFDRLLREVLPDAGDYPELGGYRDPEHRTFHPTGETASFLLAGDVLERRFDVQRLFHSGHWFSDEGILHLEQSQVGEPVLSGKISLDPDLVALFTVGEITPPRFSTQFPAQELQTDLTWGDLVLSDEVSTQISSICGWVNHHQQLRDEWNMADRLRPGYRALFYGPPGTGKTLTASLLGSVTGKKVFRVDLSTVTSKYIGETEKNLANLFDRANNRDWMLFFDEADALFGKRTEVKDSHDKYANQEASYLLQRVEEFEGLIILASNFKSNMDDAFLRRFNTIVRFPFPDVRERDKIWRAILPAKLNETDRTTMVNKFSSYELTGGNIVNVVQAACLNTLARGNTDLQSSDVEEAIRLEIEKEGKLFKPAA